MDISVVQVLIRECNFGLLLDMYCLLLFLYYALVGDGPQRARQPIPPTATLPSCL